MASIEVVDTHFHLWDTSDKVAGHDKELLGGAGEAHPVYTIEVSELAWLRVLVMKFTQLAATAADQDDRHANEQTKDEQANSE